MLFSRESAEQINDGSKVLTCRAWLSPRVKVGNIYWAQLRMLDVTSRFAKIRVISIEEFDGYSLTDEEVRDEGFDTYAAFCQAYYFLNKSKLPKKVRKNMEGKTIPELAQVFNDIGRIHYKIRFEVVWKAPNFFDKEAHS